MSLSALELVRDGGKAGSVEVAGTEAVAADSIDVAKGVGTVAGTMGAVAAGQLPPDQVGLACPDTLLRGPVRGVGRRRPGHRGIGCAAAGGVRRSEAGDLADSAGITNGVLNAAIEGTARARRA